MTLTMAAMSKPGGAPARASPYTRVRASGCANGTPYQPSTTWGPETPRPSMSRPPERWSRVTAAMAVAAGVRALIWITDVPSLIRLVRAPYHANGVSASEPHDSAVQTDSYPRRSAARTVGVASPGVVQ